MMAAAASVAAAHESGEVVAAEGVLPANDEGEDRRGGARRAQLHAVRGLRDG